MVYDIFLCGLPGKISRQHQEGGQHEYYFNKLYE